MAENSPKAPPPPPQQDNNPPVLKAETPPDFETPVNQAEHINQPRPPIQKHNKPINPEMMASQPQSNSAPTATTTTKLTQDTWIQWLLSNRAHFSKMIWSFLVHSECVSLIENTLVINLIAQHFSNVTPLNQEQMQQQINNRLPNPLQIEIQERTHTRSLTLHEQLKQQLISNITTDETFIKLNTAFDLNLVEEKIKVH